MKKLSLRRLFDNNRFVLVFSVFIAVLCWVTVAMTSGDTRPRSIGNVPIRLPQEELDARGLSVVGGDTHVLADVMVEGPWTLVGNLAPEDIDITLNLTRVTEADTYTLPLVAAGADEYTVTGITPASISLRLDAIVTKTLEVDLISSGGSTSPDYLMAPETVTPANIRVTGPAQELDKLAGCTVTVELPQGLESNYHAEVPLVLLDQSGNGIDPAAAGLTLSQETVSVFYPILRQKELELRIDFTNLPSGFSETRLREFMRVSNETITVAGPAGLMENYDELLVGVIDLHEITVENNTFPFEIELPGEQFININSLNVVQAEFDTSTWGSAVINGVANITPSNVPLGHSVTMITNTMPAITFIGEADALETLSADDVQVVVNLSEKNIDAPYQGLYPAHIRATTRGLVWAIGEPSVIIEMLSLYDNTAEEES